MREERRALKGCSCGESKGEAEGVPRGTPGKAGSLGAASRAGVLVPKGGFETRAYGYFRLTSGPSRNFRLGRGFRRFSFRFSLARSGSLTAEFVGFSLAECWLVR